jgi:myo-inositol-1(or 4)-monophosphatase
MSVAAHDTMLVRLAREARQLVVDSMRAGADQGEIAGRAATGDVTFGIDKIVEEFLAREAPKRFPGVALYTEDEGLRVPDPWRGATIVADPIDGTRPTLAGLGASCVSLALCEGGEDATFGDVSEAALIEIGTGAAYWASKGRGAAALSADGIPKAVELSQRTDTSGMFWSYEVCCRPVESLLKVYGELIDSSSWKGGCFLLNSASFSLARLLGGRIDAYVDAWGRLAADDPEARRLAVEKFGHVWGLMPYDIAAAHLVVKEAGCAISDAYGQPLDDRRLLETPEEGALSCVAASNPVLHGKLLEAIDRGIGGVRPVQ